MYCLINSKERAVEEVRQSFPGSSQRMGNRGIFGMSSSEAMLWLRPERFSLRRAPRAPSKDLNSQTAALSEFCVRLPWADEATRQ